MKKITMLLVIAFILCSNSRAFTNEDIQILSSNHIDLANIQELKAISKKIHQLYSYDKNFNDVKVQGVIINVKPNSGMTMVLQLRKLLQNTPYQAYLYDNNFGYDDDEVAVVATKDDIEYLKIIRTSGINNDLTAEDVLKKYIEWKSVYDLKLLGAGRDWLEAKIVNDNVNWTDFANKVYKFCPDVVDQGTGTVEELKSEMRKLTTLYLWWD